MKPGRVHFDVRLLGAGLLAAVTALTVLLVTSPPERTPVLVAGSDLPAGVPLVELDLVSRGFEHDEGLVAADSLGSLESHVLIAPVADGAPLLRSLLVGPESLQSADLLGLALDSAAAVHGWLRAGDRVDIYSVSAEVDLIAQDVPVVDVAADGDSLGSGRVRVLIAVTGDLGSRVLAAGELGSIHLIRKGT